MFGLGSKKDSHKETDLKQLFATFKTSMGDFKIELELERTPETTWNFVNLAEGRQEGTGRERFYDGLVFHRVIDQFMIQGGCPEGRGTGGPGYKFQDEFNSELRHDQAGILSMANAGPGTNGSQFFITLVPTPHLDGNHTVFGKVVEGMDVIESIGKVATGFQDRPSEDVVINTVEIERIQ